MATSLIEADRFASGVTGFADRAQEPLQTYLRAITGSAGLAAAVSDARVETPPAPPSVPAPPPTPSLTKTQRNWARFITVVTLVLVFVFVLVVLF